MNPEFASTSNPDLSGLIRKRQEIAAELDRVQAKLRQLILDFDAVDATIRLFQPDMDLSVVKVCPKPRRHEAHRGDTGYVRVRAGAYGQRGRVRL